MRPPSATSALFPYTTLFRSYNSGDLIAIKSFMAVSVVGLGRNGGAIIGALLVAGTEGYVGRYWSNELSDIVVLIAFLVVLYVAVVRLSGGRFVPAWLRVRPT